jgi:hypothetical protein
MDRLRRTPFLAISAVFAAAWVFAAWLAPGANYFLFPVLVAGSMPVAYRLSLGRPLPGPLSAAAAVAGIVNALVLAAVLTIAGKLRGPTTLPAGGHVLDALLWAVIGGGLGAAAASWGVSRHAR